MARHPPQGGASSSIGSGPTGCPEGRATRSRNAPHTLRSPKRAPFSPCRENSRIPPTGLVVVCKCERMRLQRGVEVAGIEPGIARDVARACHGDWTLAEYVAERLPLRLGETVAMLGSLQQEGFLECSEQKWGDSPKPVCTTTLSGGSLAQASFLKPITRERAERLLAGVVERAVSTTTTPAS